MMTSAALMLLMSTPGRAQTPPPSGGQPTATVVKSLPVAAPEVVGMDGATSDMLKATGDGLSAYRGQTITSVAVDVIGWRWRDPFDLNNSPVGQPLTGSLVRRAMNEIRRTGRAAEIRATASPAVGGVKLLLSVVPRRVAADVRVSGGVLDTATTLRAVELARNTELTERKLTKIVAGIQRLYARQGYGQALVSIVTRNTDNPLRVLVELTISAGEARTISRRTFYIETVHKPRVGKLKDAYAVKQGARVDEDALDEADNAMVTVLREHGFLDARVSHHVRHEREGSFLYVRLDSGQHYSFAFSGNRLFSADALKTALGLDSIERADATELRGKLRTLYRHHGRHDVRVDYERRDFPRKGKVSLRFHVVEGTALHIIGRQFPCFPPGGAAGLTRADLNREIDAVLEEQLPKSSLFGSIEESTIDGIFETQARGSRAPTPNFAPARTFTAKAYARALAHLKSLLNARGYANAQLGPVSLVRAECDPTARGGRCGALPLPRLPPGRCAKDALDLPRPEPELDDRFSCQPVPDRSISCAPVARMRIPIQLGPRTTLYDMTFEGYKAIAATELAPLTKLQLGEAFSNQRLESARQRLIREYQNRGYHYASITTRVEQSPDRTRARANFSINEGMPVVITAYEVRGTRRTDPELVLSRLVLCQDLRNCSREGRYYRQNLVTESEEHIAQLGVFSSVSISLEKPEIPEKRKRVIINVIEERSQYLEPRIGFSTGDGVRAAFEYGHRNVGGKAIGLTLRLEFNYLSESLILDDGVRKNYEAFSVAERLERRNSISLRIPDIGLGPKVALVVDGVDVRDNQRDFGLTREAFLPSIDYRPHREVRLGLGASVEVNDVTLFDEGGIAATIAANPSLANLLRVPEGRTVAISQRFTGSWDRRDDSFAATSGTLLTSTIEHVTALPLDDPVPGKQEIMSEFLRLKARAAGYIRLADNGLALALSVAGGYNLQLRSDSQTYPDRLFFLGGVGTIRGFLLDSLVPEDLAQEVLDAKVDIASVGVRGGNIFINPRLELRLPITDVFHLGLFGDAGNLWRSEDMITSPSQFFRWRYTAGAGVRVSTPIGPIALDYGVNLIRREWEDFGALHFSIGLF
ncbi:MAG: POTRA domain-containing protein [Polyangiaceae bacterium]